MIEHISTCENRATTNSQRILFRMKGRQTKSCDLRILFGRAFALSAHTHTMWMQQLDALIENSDYISFVQRKSSFVKLIVVQKQNHFLKRKKGVRKRGRERERRKKHLTLVFNLGWMWTDNEYLQCTAIVSEYFPFFIFRYRHNGRKFRGNNYFSFFSAIVSNEMHDTRANGKPIEAST